MHSSPSLTSPAPTGRTSAIQRARQVRRVLATILAANWAVAAAKVGFGAWSGSAAVTADGLHSFIDGGSNVLALLAMGVAAEPADADHPYGHAKFEALASLAIGAMVGVGGLEAARLAFRALVQGEPPAVSATMAGVMVCTLLVNLLITRVETGYGRRLQSPLLLADARHTLSDVFVTLAVLASLLLSSLGVRRADGAVALGVLVVVAWVAYGIVRQAVSILSDTARLVPGEVCRLACAVPEVRACRNVRSRGMEGAVYVDLTIEVDPTLSTAHAHQVADAVEGALVHHFPEVVDVVVHVEPAGAH